MDPNRCGEPMNPLEGTLALRGGEEVGTGIAPVLIVLKSEEVWRQHSESVG